MRGKRVRGWHGLAIAVLFCLSGCLGPNHATGHLGQWNNELDGKWGNEVAFVLLLPVYVVFSLGDVLIFNSIQWWSGDNPISAPAEPGPTL